LIKLEPRYCALCGADALKAEKYAANFSDDDFNAAVFSARRMPDGRHFRFARCTTCGLLFSDPACDPSTLEALYTRAAVTYDRQEEQIYGSYAPVLDRALPRLRHRGDFLEIGGGRGFMLAWGVQNGFARQIEVEPSSDAEEKFEPPGPNGRFIRGIFKKGLLPDASVSLACFFQMLDHIPDPLGFLKDVVAALEPGGAAVCVTHDTSALSARLLGEKSPIFDIEHTYLYNPDNLKRLFAKAGFTAIETFPVSNAYAVRHWLHLAPLPSLVKKPLTRVLERTKVAELKLRVNAGNFGIVGVKPAP
jgi:SAM-dependent methyltransferase